VTSGRPATRLVFAGEPAMVFGVPPALPRDPPDRRFDRPHEMSVFTGVEPHLAGSVYGVAG
jgi:hypothetical protein